MEVAIYRDEEFPRLHPSDRPLQLPDTLMMMFISLISVLLLSSGTCQVDAVAAPVPTFKQTDPITGNSLECDRCPPGTYLRSHCTSTQKSVCAQCPPGSFTARWNYIPKCLRCGMCGMNQVVKSACAPDSDCQCQCRDGFYYKKSYDMCLRHSECPSGEGVLSKGTPDDDTVCQICPNGTFSNAASAHLNCTEHTSCNEAGLTLLLKGSTWHDSVCANCENLKSRDGADYIKEILPSFFVHQKINIKRLRRILHNLEHGKKGATAELNLSDVLLRLNTWVASAAPSQVRQLPEILKKVGAENTGERLHNKLQRIDSKLNELCGLRNEVDGPAVLRN